MPYSFVGSATDRPQALERESSSHPTFGSVALSSNLCINSSTGILLSLRNVGVVCSCAFAERPEHLLLGRLKVLCEKRIRFSSTRNKSLFGVFFSGVFPFQFKLLSRSLVATAFVQMEQTTKRARSRWSIDARYFQNVDFAPHAQGAIRRILW